MGKYREELEQLQREAQAQADHQAQIQLLLMLGICAYYRSELGLAVSLCHHALQEAELAQAPALVPRIYNVLGLSLQGVGQIYEALKYYQHSLEASLQLNDKDTQLRINSNIAFLYYEIDDFEEACQLYEKVIQVATGHQLWEMTLSSAVGAANCYLKLDPPQEVLDLVKQYTQIAQMQGYPSWEGRLKLCWAGVLLNSGDLEESLDMAVQAFDSLDLNENLYYRVKYMSFIANVQIRLGKYESAINNLKESLELVGPTENKMQEIEILGFLGLVYEKLGDADRALSYTREQLKLEKQVHRNTLKTRSQNLTLPMQVELLEREAEIERLRNVELAQANQALQESQQALLYQARYDALTDVASRQ